MNRLLFAFPFRLGGGHARLCRALPVVRVLGEGPATPFKCLLKEKLKAFHFSEGTERRLPS
eukprot:1282339-Amphidinium_carterae.1